MELNKYLEKAEVLVEALPYIQRFNRKIIVVKYGGSAMLDESLMNHVIEDAVCELPTRTPWRLRKWFWEK